MSLGLVKDNAGVINELKPINPLEVISLLPQIAANSVSVLFQQCDIAHYKSFLNMMYHYTLPSEDLLLLASDKIPIDEIKKFFIHQSEEERGHYRMARDDLVKGCGGKVSELTPSSVQEYKQFWESLSSENSLAYLGAVYVFENIGKFAYKNVIDMMQRLQLENRQTVWLRTHLEADVAHGDEAHELVEKYVGSDQRGVITYGAVQGCNLWVKIFQEAFS